MTQATIDLLASTLYKHSNLKIRRGMSDNMWSCTFNLASSDCPNRLDRIVVAKPGKDPLFYGPLVDIDRTLEPAGDEIECTAYSMDWYLTQQSLPYNMIVSRIIRVSRRKYETPTDYAKRLFYFATKRSPQPTGYLNIYDINEARPLTGMVINPITCFEPSPQWLYPENYKRYTHILTYTNRTQAFTKSTVANPVYLTGQTSGATAKIVDIDTTNKYLYLVGIHDDFEVGEIVKDDESPKGSAEVAAWVDRNSPDWPAAKIPSVVMKQFRFDSDMTFQEAIEELEDYANLVFYAHPVRTGTATFEYRAYMVNEYPRETLDVRLGLGGPALNDTTEYKDMPVGGDIIILDQDVRGDSVKAGIKVQDMDQTALYNTITVAVGDKGSGYWTKKTCKSKYSDYTRLPSGATFEPVIEFRYETADPSDVDKGDYNAAAWEDFLDDWCQATARTLRDYFKQNNKTYVVTVQGVDLFRWELYRRIQLLNYTSVPETTMRITDVELDLQGMTTRLEIMSSAAWGLARKVNDMLKNPFSRDLQRMKKKLMRRQMKAMTATVTSISGDQATIRIKKGDDSCDVTARLLNQ